MTIKNLYTEENQNSQEKYEKSIESIKKIVTQTQNFEAYPDKNEFIEFFFDLGVFILKMCDFEKRDQSEHFSSHSTLELMEENTSFFAGVLPENYDTSWVNPTYAVQKLGDNFGQLFSFFFTQTRKFIHYAFLHKRFEMAEWNDLFIETFHLIEDKLPNYEELRNVMTRIDTQYRVKDQQIRLMETYDPDFEYFINIINDENLSDERYLFMLGCYINDNVIRVARHMQTFSEGKVKELAVFMADAYELGFANSDKDMSKKSTVMLIYPAGFERIIKYLLNALQTKGLKVIVRRVTGATTNKQYHYDHRFDGALYIDEALVEKIKENLPKAYELCKEYTDKYSGLIYFETFGEEPFSPKVKKECLKLDKDQQKLAQQIQQISSQITFTYTPREETSFSIISFPTPDIGDKFEEIFDATYAINMLKNEVYEPIQQKIIDALDTAEYAHIKGKGSNQTDLKVRLSEIADPKKQTNFVNCTADVNIPLGEVFTSPQLTGTNGILHIEETYLGGLRYKDLKLIFKDGFVEDYSCKNFENNEENRK